MQACSACSSYPGLCTTSVLHILSEITLLCPVKNCRHIHTYIIVCTPWSKFRTVVECKHQGCDHTIRLEGHASVTLCCCSKMQVGTSIAAGIEFGYQTSTTLSVQPPSPASWGSTLYLHSTISSLNPTLFNVTSGTVQWTLDDVLLNSTTVTGKPLPSLQSPWLLASWRLG